MFKLTSKFKPTGDQPQAIKKLTQGIKKGYQHQTLLGVTGSGKTFSMASVIENIQKPTLIISPNKTLAAQLYSEFREFFPKNAVHYFVSYYDYYQPEAYVPHTDIYIEKEAQINEEIDRLRHAATHSLLTRDDVLIVASVSCIYGLGSPKEYNCLRFYLKQGEIRKRNLLLRQLVNLQYKRNDYDFKRGSFRVKGDTLEIFPAYSAKEFIRIEFLSDEIERITLRTIAKTVAELKEIEIFPATHYLAPENKLQFVINQIKEELAWQLKKFKKAKKLVEADRLMKRTKYDLEMIREVGYCNGIENYSRYFDSRQPGQPPYTLLNYYPEDFLLFMDESHIGVPQVRGMYAGDRSRKEILIEHGFRLPSAKDNRPFNFQEFEKRLNQVIYVSATPGDYEFKHSQAVVEQLIRPTGLLDPKVEVRSTEGQIDDLIKEIEKRVAKKQRVLVTTLTKRMAEELADFLQDEGIKVQYLHSEIETLDRVDILQDLRKGVYDVVVGINLLREGLDLPEVSLVAILDADKEGFLRNETSLIQTMGRASRHQEGQVIMYADTRTGSIKRAIREVTRRRRIQKTYNKKHGILPRTITKELAKPIIDIIEA